MLLSGEQRKGFEIPQDPYRKSALVLSRHYDKRGNLEYTEMEVHSPHIMAALRKINLNPRGGRNVSLDANPIVIRQFERYIFHIHPELRQCAKTLIDLQAAAHVELTLQYLNKTLHQEMRTYYNHVE